jgi:ribonuclease HII
MDAIRLPPHLRANLSRERKLARCGHGTIAGIDEVGRGPLAGPVVAAAVVLDLKRVPKGLADSKALTLDEREALFEKILATARVGIASVSHLEIDTINIRQASLSAMCRALAALPCIPDIALVDGNDPPNLPCRIETIVKGDARVASIAAASIVAKVVRDRLMKRLAASFPAYGFSTNVGYRSPGHIAALAAHGPCTFHRRTFAPVRMVDEA